MGNSHLANGLPKTRNWREVVNLVASSADASQVAAATLDASLQGLRVGAEDPALLHAVSLLFKIPLAAKTEDFVDALRDAGLDVGRRPTLFDITAAFTDAVDRAQAKVGGKTDLGEMAQLAAVETIEGLVGERTRSLFGTTPEDVQRTFEKFGTTAQMGGLMREFFSRFTRRYLTNFLSREVSNLVGQSTPDQQRPFANIHDHAEFNRAIETHCREASAIVERFAGEWFSKTNYEQNGIPRELVARFVPFALKKLRKEFERRATA
jgi:hypothetical protein